MKILIWLGTLFVTSTIITLINSAGISLGALPNFLIYSIAFYVINVLCNRVDRKRNAKENVKMNHQMENNSETLETTKSSKLPASRVSFYVCPDCGSLHEKKLVSCTCGYKRPSFWSIHKRFLITTTILTLLTAVISLGSIAYYLYNQIENLDYTETSYETVKTRFEKQLKYDNQQRDDGLIFLRPETVSRYVPEFIYMRNNVAVITASGSKFHHLNCRYISDGDFYIYNVESAVSKGFSPCSVCWEDGLISISQATSMFFP